MHSLELLQLKGNFLDALEISCFAYGLKSFEGHLKCIDLSKNLIGELGMIELGGALKAIKNVDELNSNACDVKKEGAFRVAQLVSLLKSLKILRMENLPFTELAAKKIVESLKQNFDIEEIHYKSSNLSIVDDMNIRILLERNKFCRENPIYRKDFITEEDEKTIKMMRKTKR